MNGIESGQTVDVNAVIKAGGRCPPSVPTAQLRQGGARRAQEQPVRWQQRGLNGVPGSVYLQGRVPTQGERAQERRDRAVDPTM